VKCAVVERAHRTLRNKFYRYFIYKKTYRFVNVLQQFVKAHNNTVHTAHGMALAAVTDKRVLEILSRMNDRRSRVRVGKVKFNVRQHVRISKEKIKFAKGSEQNYAEEIFRIVRVIRRTHRPVYELEDLNGTLIEEQYYGEELTTVRVTKRSVYKIDKLVDKRYRNGILEYLIHWKGYRRDFNSWVPAASVQNIRDGL